MPTVQGQVRLDGLLRVCSPGGQINRDLLLEMLLLFVNENDRRIQQAIAADDESDSSSVRCEAHAVQGSAALIGAEALRDLAADLELRILSGTLRNLEVSARRMRNEFNAVVATVRRLCPDLCPNSAASRRSGSAQVREPVTKTASEAE